MSKPVFFDPEGTRHRRVGFWAAGTSLLLAVLTTAFIVSLFVVPLLPKVKGLSDTIHRPARLIPRLPDAERRKDLFLASRARQELSQEVAKDKKRLELQKANAHAAPVGSTIVAAFYAPYQEVGITSFRQNAKSLTHLFPVWLRVDRTAKGWIDDADFDPKANIHNPELIDLARRNGVHIWPVVTNMRGDTPDESTVSALLASDAAQREFATTAKAWLAAHNFEGLNLDLEELKRDDYERLPAFLGMLQKTLREANLGLSVDLQAMPTERGELAWRSPNLKAIAANVDLVIAMVYDEHSEDGQPGPIASTKFTQDQLDLYGDLVPTNKLVIGIGSYAYDWPKGQNATSITFQAALQNAQGYRDGEPASDVIQTDDASANPYFTYNDDNDQPHTVWMLDGVTAFNQWKLARDIGVRGSALWLLGTEDPSIWRFLNRGAIDREPDPQSLRTVEYGPEELEFVKNGDILYAKGSPQSASREVALDPNGLISNETYNGYASSYYIQRAGFAGPKTLALTFDDGPDPVYTPQILDVLKENGIAGTFFVIGRNAEGSPDLLRRMVAEGHEIGSHTFNHPNLDVTSDRRTELELNATERAIQGITGRTTVLFRPPYNADSEPTRPEDIRPILLASKLGYVTVGESLDPQDWRLGHNADGSGPRRSPQEIADAVRYQLSMKEHGNVVLLHDGGGDRSTTVAALRLLIPQLKARGYQFVPVSQLIGTSRDAVMPVIGAKDRALIGFDKFAFGAIFTFEWVLRLAFLIAIFLGLARVVLMVPLALIQNRRRVVADPRFQPSVSVLIAAYNEEKVVGRTIKSILASDYPITEVIVVDDGSTDETFLEVVTAFAGEPRVLALKQVNGGKASALNRALSQARGEIVVCIDADTQLRSDAIGLLVPHFRDRAVGAVAGNVKVGNRVNLLTNWQSVEYITSQNLDRRAYGLLNAISVCPGAIGAWRKTALVESGGYMSDTLAEDMDLTWRLRRAEWKVETESRAIAFTEAPDTFRAFFRQRFRWAFGTLQCLWKHRRALGRHGWFGAVTLPTLWLFQIVFQILGPLVDLQLFYTAVMFLVAWASRSGYTQDWRPSADVQQTLIQVGFLYGLFFTVELVSGLIAYRMDRERAGSLWWLFLQRFVYRQIMYLVIYRSFVSAIRGRRQGWGKLERKATVEIEAEESREKASVR